MVVVYNQLADHNQNGMRQSAATPRFLGHPPAGTEIADEEIVVLISNTLLRHPAKGFMCLWQGDFFLATL
jgi:hypothetical protein